MSTDNSLSTVENPETTPSPAETPDTSVSERSLREELAAALNLDTGDTPTESVADVTADAQAETETVAETPVVETQEPPAYWPADEKARFAQLAPETQKFLLSRVKEQEADYTRKTQEVAEQRRAAEEITKVFEPYKQDLELSGMTPSQITKQLLAAHKFLVNDPVNALKWLAQSYKVQPETLVPPKEEEAYIDPTVKALRDELNQVKAQLQYRAQTEQQQSSNEVLNTIKAFQESKNEDGTPKYPHFEQVRDVMGPLVAKGKTLEQAYEIASYTLPETIERIKDEVSKTAIADAAKKAEEARKLKAKEVKGATQVIRSRGTAAEESAKPGSLRQELAKNLAALSSGRI